MIYLSLPEVIQLHVMILQQSGGSAGTRDFGALASALAQPRMTFGGVELYPTLPEKAAALCFSLVIKVPDVKTPVFRLGYVDIANDSEYDLTKKSVSVRICSRVSFHVSHRRFG